jgi:kynureninase
MPEPDEARRSLYGVAVGAAVGAAGRYVGGGVGAPVGTFIARRRASAAWATLVGWLLRVTVGACVTFLRTARWQREAAE